MRERTRLEKSLGAVREIEQGLEDAVGLIELAEAENDQATLDEAEAELAKVAETAAKKQLESLLSGEADDEEIEPVAGVLSFGGGAAVAR